MKTMIPSGMPLVAGAHLRSSDLYHSTSGKWKACPAPGIVIQEGASVQWLRPNGLTADELRLLATLSSRGKGCFDCIAQMPRRAREFTLIPNPEYVWDPRIENPPVEGHEHIQSLLDIGYLERKKSLRSGSDTEFFVLTNLGWSAAAQLRN